MDSIAKHRAAIRKLQAEIKRDGRADAYITWNDENEHPGEPYTGNYKVFEVVTEGEWTGLDCKEYSGVEVFIPFSDVINLIAE